jgi:hypothetical protein
MDTAQTLLARYSSVGIARGSDVLLRYLDALTFVEDCERLGVTILGVDFYREEGGTIVPLDLPTVSADWSSLATRPDAVHKSADETRYLIRDGFPDRATLASFVVDE